MKILIPSNDKTNIADNFIEAKYYLIFEAGNGFVKLSETRVNPYSAEEMETDKISKIFDFVCDCDNIICHQISKELSDKLKSIKIVIMKTKEIETQRGIVNTFCR